MATQMRDGNNHKMVWVLGLMVMIIGIGEASTPPGIANNPSHARCLDDKYKTCYNLEHVCPKFCPNGCTVDCQSCKPVCIGGAPPPESNGGSPILTPTPQSPQPSPISTPPTSPSPPPPVSTPPTSPSQPPPVTTPPTSPSPPPPVTTPPTSPSPPPPVTTPPTSPSPPPPVTTPPTSPSPPPPVTTPPTSPSPPPPVSPPPTSPSPPPPVTTPPTSPPPPPPVITPPTSPSLPPSVTTPPASTPSSSPAPYSHVPVPSPPLDYDEAAGARRRRCNNRNYPNCYWRLHVCPSSCPRTCQVDCVTCKPVCSCDMPGAVCQDPRFIGGDGITFYFHGKKDKDFCLVTDPNLHINAHFIGKRNENMKRDFTWVQSIAILFGDHGLSVGARKTATWNDAVDRLSLSFDGEPIFLPATDGASWQSEASPSVAVRRDGNTNTVTIEIEGLLKISAKVVPITQQESKIHNYGITDDDCFAHLELAFKFFSLTGTVNGVLGQTYGSGYVSRVKVGVPVPVIGGEKKFAVSSLFATDCAVSQFGGGKALPSSAAVGLELPSMKCGSGYGGRGVVCKK